MLQSFCSCHCAQQWTQKGILAQSENWPIKEREQANKKRTLHTDLSLETEDRCQGTKLKTETETELWIQSNVWRFAEIRKEFWACVDWFRQRLSRDFQMTRNNCEKEKAKLKKKRKQQALMLVYSNDEKQMAEKVKERIGRKKRKLKKELGEKKEKVKERGQALRLDQITSPASLRLVGSTNAIPLHNNNNQCNQCNTTAQQQ